MNDKEILDEAPDEIIDEDFEETSDNDLVGEEDENLEEITDEDLIGEDEDYEEDEDVEESEDEDYEEDEDVEESEDEDYEEDKDVSECGDSDPIASDFNRIIKRHNRLKNIKLQKQAIDALSNILSKKIAARDNLAKKVMPLIGNFQYKSMDVNQVAQYACDKLDIPVSAKNAQAALKGYLSAVKQHKSTKLYTLDSAIRNSYVEDEAIEEYLKGEK